MNFPYTLKILSGCFARLLYNIVPLNHVSRVAFVYVTSFIFVYVLVTFIGFVYLVGSSRTLT